MVSVLVSVRQHTDNFSKASFTGLPLAIQAIEQVSCLLSEDFCARWQILVIIWAEYSVERHKRGLCTTQVTI